MPCPRRSGRRGIRRFGSAEDTVSSLVASQRKAVVEHQGERFQRHHHQLPPLALAVSMPMRGRFCTTTTIRASSAPLRLGLAQMLGDVHRGGVLAFDDDSMPPVSHPGDVAAILRAGKMATFDPIVIQRSSQVIDRARFHRRARLSRRPYVPSHWIPPLCNAAGIPS